jgi:hypothetical protein
MVTVFVAIAAAHPPAAAILLVTVYVPPELAETSICPVAVLTKTKPAGAALKVPALAPAGNVGVGSAPLVQ